MKKILVIAAAAAVAFCSCKSEKQDKPLYLNEDAPIEKRVEDALSRMTLEEKVKILHAQSKFSSAGVPRLGIPELWCSDGPHGIRAEVYWDLWSQAGWTSDSCTAYPSLTCLAASWDRDLAALYGKSIGEEARYREKDVLLAPGVNIYRTPLGGRNFEYMGEDPYLSGQMAARYIQGVQKNGVAACVKHFCLNNEETNRHTVNIDVSDRALYEIYLPAFKTAIEEGDAWSIMGSYNLYRGQHMCHNKRVLMDILKGEWNYDGAVISDWGGCHNLEEAAANGLDLEFGTWTDGLTMGATNSYDKYFFANSYLEKLRSGELPMDDLNDKCRRVLRLMMKTSMNTAKPFGSFATQEHFDQARSILDGGIVLLKNEGSVLPVKAEVKKIAVIGENAIKKMTVGGGSSSLKSHHEISPLAGITQRAQKAGMEVTYARGYVGSTSNLYSGVSTGQNLADDRTPEELIAEAVQLAANSDIVLFFGGLNKDYYQDAESDDRKSMDLPYGQDALIEALAAANQNFVFCNVSGNAVTMPWIEKVPSILQVWYGGSETGNGIADVVFGDVNPSGKLPFTFPVALEDGPAHQPGMTFPSAGDTYYPEGIYVGYRWYEAKDIKPQFAFGHGESYTTFEFGEARLSAKTVSKGGKLTVSVPVKNTGDVAGAEVVQLYITDPECTVDRPVKELKGFDKVYLQPGETKVVKITFGTDALQYFDENAHEWVAEPGEYVARVGAASDDIRSSVSFRLK